MRHVSALLSAVIMMLAAGGCVTNPDEGTSPVDRVAEAAAQVPEEIRKAGVLLIGTEPTFEPITYMKGSDFAGLDVDLGNTLAASWA